MSIEFRLCLKIVEIPSFTPAFGGRKNKNGTVLKSFYYSCFICKASDFYNFLPADGWEKVHGKIYF
ncbi:MAG: hypothetical protein LBR79_05060 [Oscillospiraceae bacterium]|nr:hypothetical protein [Oscillospiraceae bacterium]